MENAKGKQDLDSLAKANEENRKNIERLSEKVDDLESEIADLKSSQFESQRFDFQGNARKKFGNDLGINEMGWPDAK